MSVAANMLMLGMFDEKDMVYPVSTSRSKVHFDDIKIVEHRVKYWAQYKAFLSGGPHDGVVMSLDSKSIELRMQNDLTHQSIYKIMSIDLSDGTAFLEYQKTIETS